MSADWIVDWLMGLVAHHDHPLGLIVLGASAMIEYIFPPFPGDTVTLFGAVLISAYDWSFSFVFGSVMVGSVTGSMLDYAIGTRLQKLGAARDTNQEESKRHALIRGLIEKFRRHGAIYLLVSRFLPGVRALVFVAAGAAGSMSAKTVLFYAVVSAFVWNLVIVGLGVILGLKFAELVGFAQQYSAFVLTGLGVLAVFFATRALLRRRHSQS